MLVFRIVVGRWKDSEEPTCYLLGPRRASDLGSFIEQSDVEGHQVHYR